MRSLISTVLFIAISSPLLAQEEESPDWNFKSKEARAAIRQYGAAIGDLNAKGKAALKKLEDGYKKRIKEQRLELLVEFEKALAAATKSGDLDEAVKIRNAIKALHGGAEPPGAPGGMQFRSGAGQASPTPKIPKDAVKEEAKEPDWNFKSRNVRAAIRQYGAAIAALNNKAKAALKKLEDGYKKRVKEQRLELLVQFKKALDAATKSGDLDEAIKIRNAIKALHGGAQPPGAPALLVFGGGGAPPPEERGLIAYYPFNGNANDESGNNNNGTVNGATLSPDRFGRKNAAYSFDGQRNYITASFNAPRSLSVSLWFKSQYPSQWYPQMFGYEVSGKYVAAIGMNGNHPFYVRDKIVGRIGSSSTPQLNQWHHLLMIHDQEKGVHKLYVDGSLQAQGKTSSVWSTGSGKLFIGGKSSGRHADGGAGFYGTIDDVRLYNRGLSKSEAKTLYDSEKRKK